MACHRVHRAEKKFREAVSWMEEPGFSEVEALGFMKAPSGMFVCVGWVARGICSAVLCELLWLPRCMRCHEYPCVSA